MAKSSDSEKPEKVRLDKWLWAARFYKTRAMAHEAIAGGKVFVNGIRIKPGRSAEIGEEIVISTPRGDFTIVIQKVSDKRVSATLAASMFTESEQSRSARESLSVMRKLAGSIAPLERPNTQDRRRLRRIKEGGGS